MHCRAYLILKLVEQRLFLLFGGFGGREVCLWSDSVVGPISALSFH